VNLDYLACSNNNIKKLNLRNNHFLAYLYCRNNCLVVGNIKLSYHQLRDTEYVPQKRTIRLKKIGKYYYVPLKGIQQTNEITKLSAGKITDKGIWLTGKKVPKKITYEYNMFTDGENMTKEEIKVKKW